MQLANGNAVRTAEELGEFLVGVKRVYVDSIGLAQLVASIVPDMDLRTFSPSVDVPKAYDNVSSHDISLLEQACEQICEAARQALWKDDPDLATAMARCIHNRYDTLFYKFAGMEAKDFSEPTVLLQPSYDKSSGIRDTFRSPIGDAVRSYENWRTIEIHPDLLPDISDPRPPNPDILTRLKFADLGTVVYRAVSRFYAKLNIAGPRGSILVLRENELLKETALHMALRGFGVHHVSAPRQTSDDKELGEDDEALLQLLAVQCAGRAKSVLGEILCAPAIECLVNDLSVTFRQTIIAYRQSVAGWRRTIDGMDRVAPKAVLSNSVAGVEICALHSVLRDRDVPLCVFQHGVTMEYHETHHLYGSFHETASSELAVLFNDLAVQKAEGSRYAQSNGVAVGLPRDYRAATSAKTQNTGDPEIWYIATALYIGNRGMLFQGSNDGWKSDFECGVVEKILSDLPHRVAYKPYPGRRFLDVSREERLADEQSNIDLVRERIDMRYMFEKAQVLVTARAFSTPSWCVMSARPVVFIDAPGQARLTQEAVAQFKEALFYFDAEQPGYETDVKALLSKPIEEIRRLYQAKAPARKRLIEAFMASPNSAGAGKRAATHIIDLIEKTSLDSRSAGRR